MCDVVPTTRPQWKKALAELPATPEKIPTFFFAHGRTFSVISARTLINNTHSHAFHTEPMLLWPKEQRSSSSPMDGMLDKFGPDGTLAQFLQDFGKTLLSKYKPRAIAVFSAHWETHGQTLGKVSTMTPIHV
jgi:aromatic ring-opening dioxygenase catalytic subunit (LigB family)